MKTAFVFLALLGLAAATSFSAGTMEFIERSLLTHGAELEAAGAFSYDDCKVSEECPANWGQLQMPGNQCGSTARQSPIDLPLHWLVKGQAKYTLKSHYAAWKHMAVVNNGHTVQVNAPAEMKNGLELHLENGEVVFYKLSQFHVHTGSEHTVDNEQMPLEIHFVHQRVNEVAGTEPFLVIGVLFAEGPANKFVDTVLGILPPAPEHHDEVEQEDLKGTNQVNINEFLSHVNLENYWTYRGSLTTPPCSEVVHWFVMADLETVSEAQLESIKKVLPGGVNARPVLPLGTAQTVLAHAQA